jgi:putative mRNA 3-end processing factor
VFLFVDPTEPTMSDSNLLECTRHGLYCPAGDFFIDPWGRVDRAVLTHAHSDHARWGSRKYLAAKSCESLLRIRLGANIDLQTLNYGEKLRINDAIVSLHPAGHILGSAQVRIEVGGKVALITGDYKLQSDATCAPWEAVRCDLMVTESTFGLPVFRWPKTQQVIEQLVAWWHENQRQRRTSLILAYSVGKAQRIISELLTYCGSDVARDIAIHGAMLGPNRAYREAGVQLPDLPSAASLSSGHDWSRALVLGPPSSQSTGWVKRFANPSIAMASGWMAIRGTRRRRNVDRGFVLSDHVDWPDLISAIDACSPEQVWVTHGFSEVVSRYLTERGLAARVLQTHFSGEESEPATSAEDQLIEESQ